MTQYPEPRKKIALEPITILTIFLSMICAGLMIYLYWYNIQDWISSW